MERIQSKIYDKVNEEIVKDKKEILS